jgi:hypothetical protein
VDPPRINRVSYCHVGKLKDSMDERTVLPNITAKLLSFTDYKIIIKTIIPQETLLQLKWHIL